MAGTFTYTFDPTNILLDAVRLTLQDTDEDEVLLYDQEIAYFLAKSDNNILRASLEGARSIMAKFARMATREQSGKYTVYFTGKITDYKSIIDSLQDQIGSESGFGIHYGGIDIDTVDAVRADEGRVHNVFHSERLRSDYLEPIERM